MRLGYPPRSCLEDAILKCNVPPQARTTQTAYVYYALTTALLMPPALPLLSEGRIPKIRAFWFSWFPYHICSRVLLTISIAHPAAFSLSEVKRLFKCNSMWSYLKTLFNLTKKKSERWNDMSYKNISQASFLSKKFN